MSRYFNTEGWCGPDRHYMVRLEDRLEKIKRLYVDRGKYFIINRGRQYGKTTTLRLLEKYLKDEYAVISMDFQLMSSANFVDENTFVDKFIAYMEELFSRQTETAKQMDAKALESLIHLGKEKKLSMDMLFRGLSTICRTSKKPIVMIIDEVDSASNNQVFLDFLAMLCGYYLGREERAIFHSVILSDVYDVKNLKLKFRSEEEHRYNSPWNIAADFDIEMSFSAGQIGGMLREYESDHNTGMNVKAVAEEIYQYTSGYPYLVSAICRNMDEKLPYKNQFLDAGDVWTQRGLPRRLRYCRVRGFHCLTAW